MPENTEKPATPETTPALKAAIVATEEHRKTAKKPGKAASAKSAAPPPAPVVAASAESRKSELSSSSAQEAAPVPGKPAPENPKAAKAVKEKKAKLVRDSFTMPEDEYARFADIKKRCLKAGHATKKSEILRAALAALSALDDAALLAAMQRLTVIKTGRPRKRSK